MYVYTWSIKKYGSIMGLGPKRETLSSRDLLKMRKNHRLVPPAVIDYSLTEVNNTEELGLILYDQIYGIIRKLISHTGCVIQNKTTPPRKKILRTKE